MIKEEYVETFTLSRSGLFLSCGAGEGVGGFLPTLNDFASIKAMTMRLGGEKERPKTFPLRCAKSDHVI